MPSRRGGTKRVVNGVPASRLLPWVRAVAAKKFSVPEWGPERVPAHALPVDGSGTHACLTARPGTQAPGVVDLL